MGVDYDANFGLGYEIEDSGEHDSLVEFLVCELGDDFEYFQVGSGSYTGEQDDVFVCVKDPLSKGFDVSWCEEQLNKELERLGIKPSGDFGLVGGLHVW